MHACIHTYPLVLITKLDAFLGDGLKLLVLKVGDLLNAVLIDGVHQVQDFNALVLELLQERALLHGLDGFASNVVDGLLPLLGPGEVGLKAHPLALRHGSLETQELDQLGTVAIILNDTQLDALPEGLPELNVLVVVRLHALLFFLFFFVVLILSHFALGGQTTEHLQDLAGQLLGDHLQQLVLLEGLTGYVQGQVIGVDDTTDEVHVSR